MLPQLYPLPYLTHSLSASTHPGTVRPLFLTVPDVAMSLLLCVPPFHVLIVHGKDHIINTSHSCKPGDGNSTGADLDCAGFVLTESVSDVYSVWSLYMGPVYVYENEHSAGRGYEVDVTQLTPRTDEWGTPLISGIEGIEQGRVVRLLYVDEVDQLPVTRRDRDTTAYLCAPTTAACFRHRKLMEMIERTRAKWRRVVETDNQLVDEDDHADNWDDEDGEEEEWDDDMDLMGDHDGAQFEYVVQLNNALLRIAV